MTVNKFKDSPRPLVLVSPAISTGYDFAGDAARWQVLQKVPFTDKRSVLMQRRCKSDPRYPHAQAMGYIQQAVGRINRSDDDWGCTFILDGVFWQWYETNGKQYAAKWFREAVKKINKLPRGK